MRFTWLMLLGFLPVSCKHPATERLAACDAPQRVGVLPKEIKEASGIAISRRNPGIFWVHNDDAPVILFGIDSTGSLKGRIRVPEIKDADLEDIAVARCGSESCVYLGDTGDNYGGRAHALYVIPEPLISDTVSEAPVRYPFHLTDRNADMEAMFVLPDATPYMVTKGRTGPVTMLQFPADFRSTADPELIPVFSLTRGLVQVPDMVTDASVTSDGRYVAIRTYSSVQIYNLQANALVPVLPRPADLTPLVEPQGEGVAIRDDGTLFFVSERRGKGHLAPVSRMHCRLP